MAERAAFGRVASALPLARGDKAPLSPQQQHVHKHVALVSSKLPRNVMPRRSTHPMSESEHLPR
jgi:hypothetical protein